MSRARDLADGTFSGAFSADSPTLVVDATNNRVGVGETSPKTELNIAANNSGQGAKLTIENTDTSITTNDVIGQIDFYANDSSSNGTGAKVNIKAIATSTAGTATALTFGTSSSGSATAVEAARFDASGNLLVGKTSDNNATEGISLAATGAVKATNSNDLTGIFNRLTTDGDIVQFWKDTTAVGVIGNSGAYMYLASKGAGSRGVKITDNFIPADTSGNNNDNAMDLGGASVRWDDVYATNGTIQTSDLNLKTDVAELDEAEQRVATAAKGLIRKFRWIDSVEEKGDDARIHVGVIAQDLKAAFEAEGLDPGRYAMFISSTWWEADEVVPAVEEVIDEEGNVITEAQPEYTRTNTYQTAEEAPAGAVERTRLGVRYNQLLAFVIGAM